MERLRRFGEVQNVSFPLVSDSGGDLARLYDVRRWLGLGTSRVTYIIDGEGFIRDIYHHELITSGHARRALKSVNAGLHELAQ